MRATVSQKMRGLGEMTDERTTKEKAVATQLKVFEIIACKKGE